MSLIKLMGGREKETISRELHREINAPSLFWYLSLPGSKPGGKSYKIFVYLLPLIFPAGAGVCWPAGGPAERGAGGGPGSPVAR